MTNEAVDYWKASKTKGFILKLHIEKAFDKINLDFIDYMPQSKKLPYYLEKMDQGLYWKCSILYSY